jgi:hypothetical protein
MPVRHPGSSPVVPAILSFLMVIVMLAELRETSMSKFFASALNGAGVLL